MDFRSLKLTLCPIFVEQEFAYGKMSETGHKRKSIAAAVMSGPGGQADLIYAKADSGFDTAPPQQTAAVITAF